MHHEVIHYKNVDCKFYWGYFIFAPATGGNELFTSSNSLCQALNLLPVSHSNIFRLYNLQLVPAKRQSAVYEYQTYMALPMNKIEA
jgi:hypothetical protein